MRNLNAVIAIALSIILSAIIIYFATASWRVHLLFFGTLLASIMMYLAAARNIRSRYVDLLFYVFVGLFALTVGVRFFLISVYNMEPRSLLIIQAVSNTKTSEVVSYIRKNAFIILLSALVATTFLLSSLIWANRARSLVEQIHAKKMLYAIHGAAMIALLAHFSPVFRRENPPFFWYRAYQDYTRWTKELANIQNMRNHALAELGTWKPQFEGKGSRIIVFVIGESQNRNNLGIYGYSRDTTPQQSALANSICTFRNAYSYSAATTPAFIDMLTSNTNQAAGEWWKNPTLPMLAKAANYKMYWLSNQNDRFIAATFATDFDVYKQINVGGSREDVSMDENLLPLLDEALKDAAERKFIVVHLIGSHPHYDLRYPKKFAKYKSNAEDTEGLLKAGANLPWVRAARNHYDNSILYTDFVVSRIIEKLKETSAQSRSLLYISDHSNDVGHESAFVGHAPNKKSGYEIPFFYFGDRRAACEARENAEFQSDRLLWTLLDLLEINVAVGEGKRGSIFSSEWIAKPIQKRWQ